MKQFFVLSFFLFGIGAIAEDQVVVVPAPSFENSISELDSLEKKLEFLKNRLNQTRRWIHEGLTETELDTLRMALAEEDYSQVDAIREKVINRIALLPQKERDFSAMILITFGEARGGSGKTTEEILSNYQVRAEMLAVLKVIENRLKIARARMPETVHELMDIICARKQFSCLNANDPNWIKWVLGPAIINSDQSQINFSQEYEFTQSLMAYLDFSCAKPVFSPAIESPNTLHYCADSIADETGWENDNPEARKIPTCEIWVELPPPCPEANEKVFVQSHVFFENVRIGKKQLTRDQPQADCN